MTKRAILLVSGIALILAILKLIFGIISGSIVILASALDSFIDVFFSLLNYFALQKIESPSNKNFNYGFGKLESLASLFEGLLIALSGIYIIYQSLLRFMTNEGIEHINQGIFVMIVSIFATFGLVAYLKHCAKRSQNLILQAEILHYKTDLISNLGVIISLLVVKFTGLEIFDCLLGALIGAYVCFNAFKITKNSLFMLLDKSIDDALSQNIIDLLDNNPKILSYHHLKSRLSGNTIFLECHLVFDEHISLLESHAIADEIEKSITHLSSSYQWIVLFHLDPYDDSKIDLLCDNLK